MTSFQKAQQLYHDDILKDIINQPKTTKNKNDDLDDNFWDIIQDEDDIPKNLNLSGYEKSNQKIDNNTKENDEKEKERIEILYNNLAKPKKEKINKINKPYNFNYTKKSKTLQPREGKKKRPNSVDINEDKPKAKMRTIKVDELSVFNRNQKWLKAKEENIKKAKDMLINKKQREINEYKRYQYIKKATKLDSNQIFNEENNVKYKEENLKYFLRLNKLREEKIRTPFNLLSQKINLNKYSHYSGISANNISKKEMNKCMKYIHDKLKGKK